MSSSGDSSPGHSSACVGAGRRVTGTDPKTEVHRPHPGEVSQPRALHRQGDANALNAGGGLSRLRDPQVPSSRLPSAAA
eukprot:8452084-Heterocapsa_arctica.AAC.1